MAKLERGNLFVGPGQCISYGVQNAKDIFAGQQLKITNMDWAESKIAVNKIFESNSEEYKNINLNKNEQ